MFFCFAIAAVAIALLYIIETPLAVSATCAALIYGMVAYLMRGVKMQRKYKIIVLCGILLGNLFLLIYTYFQNFIPFWDYAG